MSAIPNARVPGEDCTAEQLGEDPETGFAVVGKNDPRVPWTESRQMLDKLKGNGIPTWFLMANDEGHGYAKKKNQDFLFYATVMFVRQFLLGENVSAAAK